MLEEAKADFKDSRHVNALIATSKIRGNNKLAELCCPLILEKVPEAVIFALTHTKKSTFHFKLPDNINIDNFEDFFTSSLSEKHLDFPSFKLSWIILPISLEVTGKLSIALHYDIAEIICSYKGSNFNTICLAGNSANLGSTFKTSRHCYPPTHGYFSGKSYMSSTLEDTQQIFGRMAGVDKYPHDRKCFVPASEMSNLEKSFIFQDFMPIVFPTGNDKLVNEIMLDTRSKDPSNPLLSLVDNHRNDHLSSDKPVLFTKFSVCREIVDQFGEVLEEGDTNANQKIAESDQALSLLHFVKENPRLTISQISNLLIEKKLIQSFDSGSQRPHQISSRHFVTEDGNPSNPLFFQIINRRVSSVLARNGGSFRRESAGHKKPKIWSAC